jgi:hypothetical protein
VNRLVSALATLARWVFVRGTSQAASQERARREAERAREDAAAAERLAAELADIEKHRRGKQVRDDVESSR